MASVFLEAAQVLKPWAAKFDTCLVGYSGGKDSLVISELCSRAFRKVVGFYLWFIPGLRCIEEQLEFARQRWKMEILQYPAVGYLSRKLTSSQYGPHWYTREEYDGGKIPDQAIRVMEETGIGVCVLGMKNADHINRKTALRRQEKKYQNVINPLKSWRKLDVLAYLKTCNIPIPPSDGRVSGSIDLTTYSLLWLHQFYPDDFEKMERWFPYIRAVVLRKQLYDIPADKELPWNKSQPAK